MNASAELVVVMPVFNGQASVREVVRKWFSETEHCGRRRRVPVGRARRDELRVRLERAVLRSAQTRITICDR
jgi:hypothetical protein